MERSKKAEETAAAAANKAEWDAEQKQRAQMDAEVAQVRDTEDLAVAIHDAEVILAQAQQATPHSDDSCSTTGTEAFLHPDQVLSPQDQSPEELMRAETAVALAKHEAVRAQRQLAMAEEAASRARTQNQGKGGKASKVERPARERGDSLKALLRTSNTGSGYVPPHLRDGYTPKPAKDLLPPGYHDAGRDGARGSNPGRKKSAMTRATGRLSASKEGKGGEQEVRSPGTVSKSPDSSSSVSPAPDERVIQKDSEIVSRGGKVAKRENKKAKPAFETRNVFAMLPDEDDEDSEEM